MALKIPSAMVDRQMFPKHTKSTEMGSEDMLAGFVTLCIWAVVVSSLMCAVVQRKHS